VKALIVIAIVTAGAAAHAADSVRHVPPADAEAGSALELVAEAPATTPTLVAHVRTTGTPAWTAIELVRRDEAHWVAVVPPTAVERPGLEYYLDAGGEHVFASPEWPHTLLVHASTDDERRARDRVRSLSRRSRVHTIAEWVDYGAPTVDGMRLADHYYRIDGDFSYKLWAYPLEELHVGFTRLIGDTEQPQESCSGTMACTKEVGLIAGWFELGMSPAEGVRFDGRAIVMATQNGFDVGVRGEARLGAVDASHIALGTEYLGAVGTSAYFRLGWGTIPHLPMSATVEVTNLPADNRPYGVRLFYDVSRELAAGFRLGVRIGYAARVEQVAGFTGGATATVEF
jgi:hypothetical protein